LNDGTEANHAVKIVTPPAATVTDFPANPVRTGYGFGGWNTARDGGGTAFTASSTVSGAITVYAQWTGETYTVTFDNDGGDTAANPATKTVTRPAATIDSLPAQPSKTGYVFGGWYTGPDGGGSAFTASTTVNGSITVYALWTAIPAGSHTVTFRLNAGTESEGVHAVKPVMSPATTVTDFPGDPARAGYAFGGWYTEPDGGGTAFTASTTVIGDRTVYAKWNTYSYTVTFDDGSGNTVTRTVTSPVAVIAPLPAAPPDKPGYTFGGWYTERDGGGTEFTASTTVSGNITLYAGWIGETYTVTFDTDGGDIPADPATMTVTRPATTTGELPAPPAKTGYIFSGWYTERDGGGTEFTAWTAVNGDITVYAKWNPSYTVTFDINGGDTEADPATKTVVSPNTTVDSLPIPPAKTDYVFAGWNTQEDGSGTPFIALTTVSGDITVYAQWIPEQFNITLNLDAGEGAFTQTSFTLSKSENGSPAESHVTLTGTGYTNPRWYVDDSLKGTGTGVTINAADYGAGGHVLTLIISKGGVSWSKEITFTVTN
jgi:uncharacterized repeat protein (TIGR02543 family)